jgi:hypothetical protein
VELIKEKQQRPDLCELYFDDNQIDNEDLFDEWWDSDSVFQVKGSADSAKGNS